MFKERMTAIEFNDACRVLGMGDPDRLPPGYLAAKAVMVWGHRQGHAALMFHVTQQAVSRACRRLLATKSNGKIVARLCPCCGKPWDKRKGRLEVAAEE